MIEFAEQGGEEGHACHRRRTRSRPHPSAADPDDQLLLHLRRAAAGAVDRRRRQQPHRNRHVGHRRHADRDHPRHLLHPVVLRAGPARRARRPRRRPRATAQAARRRRHEGRRPPSSPCWQPVVRRCSPVYVRPDSAVPAVLADRRRLSAAVRGDAAGCHLSRHLPRRPAAGAGRAGVGQQSGSGGRRSQHRRRARAGTASSAPDQFPQLDAGGSVDASGTDSGPALSAQLPVGSASRASNSTCSAASAR